MEFKGSIDVHGTMDADKEPFFLKSALLKGRRNTLTEKPIKNHLISNLSAKLINQRLRLIFKGSLVWSWA